ncbi:hypothetical protein LX81_04075 [Palleronia aestuarii]|uniref:Uncharacterized protein n=1 Tax=Palleronia aestuarii TaxID=568105 RepID=A0A2W7MSL3_9RHOB|nr:hypothetical protein [Palleronia aestuarii]PZX10948.1 hypothetical protein LX81_04075 [Palleronia aestuarii]
MTEADWGEVAGADVDGFELSHRDHALFLIGERHLDAQAIAIRSILRRNREAEKQVAEEIKELDAHIRAYAGGDEEYQMHIENHWVDTLHGTVFQDAAHSMSAVGMLAPFVESLLLSIFQGLRERLDASKGSLDETTRGTSSATKFWDPRLVRDDSRWQKAGLVRGTRQLSDAIGLSPYLPEGFAAMHAALTAYRNSMFHNSFEWPMDERKTFGELIVAESWPDGWFKKSTTGSDPWIFYMSDEFIAHCLEMIDQVLKGVGRYLEQRRTGQI